MRCCRAAGTSTSAGMLVEVDGFTIMGNYKPEVQQGRVIIRGQARLPTARNVTLQEATRGLEDGQPVLELVAEDAALDSRCASLGLRDPQPAVADVQHALGDSLDLAPEHRRVTAGPNGTGIRLDLAPVDEFRGVWQLDNGELRAFERQGDTLHVQWILHRNSLEDFLFRTKLPVTDQQLVEQHSKFWKYLESLTK